MAKNLIKMGRNLMTIDIWECSLLLRLNTFYLKLVHIVLIIKITKLNIN